MNGTIPRPLRLILWSLGGVLAAGVCLTIAATSRGGSSRSDSN